MNEHSPPMNHQRIAESLLWPIWRGIPDEYKVKYARSIWQQMEDNVRSAAYTSSLSRFAESICQRLNVDLSARSLIGIAGILESGQDQDILRKLRNETVHIVILVRLMNESRREEIELSKEERKRADVSL